MGVSKPDRFVHGLHAPSFGGIFYENSPDVTRLSNLLGGYTASL